jgi:tetratricopeptide (TPR) repeat protein
MERLRKTLPRIILFSVVLGMTSFLASCQQTSEKQKSAQSAAADTIHAVPGGTDAQGVTGQDAQNQTGVSSPGKKLDHPVVLDNNYKKQANSQNAKMLNTISQKPIANLGPSTKVIVDPQQKQAQELYLSGQKKAVDGDQQGAIDDFTKSLNLYKTPAAFLKRGFSEMVQEDYVNAINDMNEVLKINPNIERAYFGRGVCKFEQKDFKGAEEDMNKFIEKDKTTAMAYNYLAGCRFMQQDFKGALDNYDMVAKLDPKYPDVYTNRGMMKHYLKDLKGAVEDYDKALAIDPDNATAYNNRGAAKLNQGDSKGALVDFDKAISLRKDYADAFDNRGKAKINLGDKTGACADFQRAYSLGIEATRELIIKYCKGN